MTGETNARNMPGFTAGNAIYKASEPYRMAGPAHQTDPKLTLVGPALRPIDPIECFLICVLLGGGGCSRCFRL